MCVFFLCLCLFKLPLLKKVEDIYNSFFLLMLLCIFLCFYVFFLYFFFLCFVFYWFHQRLPLKNSNISFSLLHDYQRGKLRVVGGGVGCTFIEYLSYSIFLLFSLCVCVFCVCVSVIYVLFHSMFSQKNHNLKKKVAEQIWKSLINVQSFS